jgi:hypothetical protein
MKKLNDKDIEKLAKTLKRIYQSSSDKVKKRLAKGLFIRIIIPKK